MSSLVVQRTTGQDVPICLYTHLAILIPVCWLHKIYSANITTVTTVATATTVTTVTYVTPVTWVTIVTTVTNVTTGTTVLKTKTKTMMFPCIIDPRHH